MKAVSLASVALATLLTGCGGGGGGSGTSITPNPIAFTAAAAKGELIQYEIDPNLLTYKYTITSSAYGLNNTPRTGTLTHNIAEDTYKPSGRDGKIAYNSDGLLFGIIKEDFGSGAIAVPVFGIKTTEKLISSIAGTYNYVSYQCIGVNACMSHYGTLKVN